jgi:outer membrane protein assembly factor BamB
MNKSREFLKEIIISRVFVRATDNQRIVAPNGTHSPWTFDFRSVVLEPQWLDQYAEVFWERFENQLPFQVGGLETAAIPLISAIVMKSNARGTPINGFYIRKSRDRDGLMKRIEGTLTNEPVILVDDIMNTGGSFLKQLPVLEEAGKIVKDIFVILAFRESKAYTFAKKRGIRTEWIFTLEDFGIPLEKASSLENSPDLYETIWKFSPGNPSFDHVLPKSAPTHDNKRTFFGTDKGVFYALNQKSGDIAWQFAIQTHPEGKGIFSSPALHKGVLYFGAYDGNVYALDAATGKKRWMYDDADWVGSSPILAPDLGLLFIGLEFGLWRKRGGIVALDLKTGTRKWQDRTPSLTHGSPLYIKEEGLVVIGSNDGIVYAYDAATGERRWTHQTGGDIKSRAAYDPRRGLVLVPSMDTKLYAFGAARGDLRWAFQSGASLYSNPLVHGDRIYMASLDKSLYALEPDSGKRLARFETGGRIFATPILADNSLWIGSNDGKLYELDPATLQMRGSHQFSERIVNAIAYNPQTETFFVPTVANELYCMRRKGAAQ